MNCPICHEPMKKVRWDISINTNENNKQYDRAVFQCEADDTWITTEIPKES